jgi:hypothetical protein
MAKLPSDFIKTAKLCGLEHALNAKGVLYVETNKIIAEHAPKGVEFKSEQTNRGIKAEVTIKSGVKLSEPLFFCFGMLGKNDEQFIIPNITLQDGAQAVITSHCSFPHAEAATHKMEAHYRIGQNAKLTYNEHHYHGESSGATVMPKLKIEVLQGGQFTSNFVLTTGSVGKVKIELDGVLGARAKSYIETKVMGKNANDIIEIMEKIHLQGENSKSLMKMRAAAKNGGQVLMQGETYASAPGAIGHVDCQEIVVGKTSRARAVPIVEVSDEQARVTHEASVGKINQKELETLMTRGLDEDQATELIINSLMR